MLVKLNAVVVFLLMWCSASVLAKPINYLASVHINNRVEEGKVTPHKQEFVTIDFRPEDRFFAVRDQQPYSAFPGFSFSRGKVEGVPKDFQWNKVLESRMTKNDFYIFMHADKYFETEAEFQFAYKNNDEAEFATVSTFGGFFFREIASL